MADQKITDEFVRNVRVGIKVVTYLLRHPTRLTSNTCGQMRDARNALEELMDQVLIMRADLEHMTSEQREAYIQSEGLYLVVPATDHPSPFAPPVLQSIDDANDITS